MKVTSMTEQNVLKKRVPRIRPIQATPKELSSWSAFQDLITATGSTQGNIAPIVQAELDRLCAKQHPLALRLKERLSIAADRPRLQSEEPKPAPTPRRITNVRWSHGENGER